MQPYVLVMEDEDALATLVQYNLEKEGYRVVIAADGEEGMLQIEELIDELRERYCIVIVTHSMAQAARVSQRTAFFHLGRLIEMGDTEDIFTNPREQRTLDYITGRFG